MRQTASQPIRTIHTAFRRSTDLRKTNLRLQAEVAALVEDNKQLRAALRIYSEVARQSPACLPIHGRVA